MGGIYLKAVQLYTPLTEQSDSEGHNIAEARNKLQRDTGDEVE